jgi:excisionase family DNA binding protein
MIGKHFGPGLFDTFDHKPYDSDMDRRDFMNTADAAKLLRVSRQTLYNWMAEGRIPEPARDARTGHMRWRPEDIQRIRLWQQAMGGEE